MIRKPRPCVRCGIRDRYVYLDGSTVSLCGDCAVDPHTEDEMRRALEADPDHPRLWLMQTANWKGGWSRAT